MCQNMNGGVTSRGGHSASASGPSAAVFNVSPVPERRCVTLETRPVSSTSSDSFVPPTLATASMSYVPDGYGDTVDRPARPM